MNSGNIWGFFNIPEVFMIKLKIINNSNKQKIVSASSKPFNQHSSKNHLSVFHKSPYQAIYYTKKIISFSMAAIKA